MKRPSSSDSLVPICPSGWLDEDDDVAEASGAMQGGEKKRRLSVEQVRALEKNFEVENKLEPERKAQLAQELGLQPRQVAVWFQNRRARWKTKQLERDYGALKSRYDALRLDYDALLRDKDSLLSEVKDLKAKLDGGEEESFTFVKEEPVVSEFDAKAIEEEEEEESIPLIYHKDGSPDSDSSAVLNDQETTSLLSLNATTNSSLSSSPFLYHQPQQLLKVEDDEFLADEPCSSFFRDEQPPTLSWYCGEGWE